MAGGVHSSDQQDGELCREALIAEGLARLGILWGDADMCCLPPSHVTVHRDYQGSDTLHTIVLGDGKTML